eukprot:1027946-Amphidinium_carterae.1
MAGSLLGSGCLRNTKIYRVRALSGKDLRTLYVLSGALPGWTSADVADILQHLKWNATPERQLGQRSWLVRADTPPHKWRHLAQAGYMRLTLEIKTFKKKEAERPAATPTAVGQRSWASVCKGPVKLDPFAAVGDKGYAKGQYALPEEVDSDTEVDDGQDDDDDPAQTDSEDDEEEESEAAMDTDVSRKRPAAEDRIRPDESRVKKWKPPPSPEHKPEENATGSVIAQLQSIIAELRNDNKALKQELANITKQLTEVTANLAAAQKAPKSEKKAKRPERAHGDQQNGEYVETDAFGKPLTFQRLSPDGLASSPGQLCRHPWRQ